MKSGILSIACLFCISSGADASMWGDNRPSIVVVSQYHGQHVVHIDEQGLPYRSGTNVPYVVQTECKFGVSGIYPNRSCGSQYGQLFDGVAVTRINTNDCSVTETTVRHFEMIRTNRATAAVPDVEVSTWRTACPIGMGFDGH